MDEKVENKKVLLSEMPISVLNARVFFPKQFYQFELTPEDNSAPFQEAAKSEKYIFIIQGKPSLFPFANPEANYRTGVIAKVRRMISFDRSDNYHVRIETKYRGVISAVTNRSGVMKGKIAIAEDEEIQMSSEQYEAYVRLILKKTAAYAAGSKFFTDAFDEQIKKVTDLSYLVDYVASNIIIKPEIKQEMLDELNVEKRALKLCDVLQEEINLIDLERDIEEKLRLQLEKSQREYHLREKINVISKELGEDESVRAEAERFREKVLQFGFSADVEEKLLRECSRMAKVPPVSSESAVIRTYLETCLDISWNTYTQEKYDTEKARKQLDRDHYGLEKVKERIIELIAVKQLAPDITGQIICLVGPPGVGKTSIAKSIAAAMNKKFERVSLGGISDEAEIRGHRKTYIGSMPGRIAEAVRRAKCMNPLILLDEIDKLDSDYKGDPASALLEVLDSEQNNAFIDHYLEIPMDLSRVTFITTANDESTIPDALYDRMEIIHLSSYTVEEKLNIAKKHLIKKQLQKHGLTANQLKFTDKGITEIIEGYTREAGVRTLERKIAEVCRKTAVMIVEGKAEKVRVSHTNIAEFLSTRKIKKDSISKEPQVGVVNGLAWTAYGGTMLEIEATVLSGSGKIQLTGQLGDVMRESAFAALTFIRTKAEEYGINENFYTENDIHVHAPEGAVPKDGPSAGVTMTTAIVSALTGIPVRSDVAMTGEVSLRGRVLPIGGLKEKSMAAYLNSIKTVFIPYDNIPDLEEISETVKNAVEFIPVKSVEEVIEKALVRKPQPAVKAAAASKPVETKSAEVKDEN